MICTPIRPSCLEATNCLLIKLWLVCNMTVVTSKFRIYTPTNVAVQINLSFILLPSIPSAGQGPCTPRLPVRERVPVAGHHGTHHKHSDTGGGFQVFSCQVRQSSVIPFVSEKPTVGTLQLPEYVHLKKFFFFFNRCIFYVEFKSVISFSRSRQVFEIYSKNGKNN